MTLSVTQCSMDAYHLQTQMVELTFEQFMGLMGLLCYDFFVNNPYLPGFLFPLAALKVP
jgi:hypothetical protein